MAVTRPARGSSSSLLAVTTSTLKRARIMARINPGKFETERIEDSFGAGVLCLDFGLSKR
jgi:hypothetical protein